ncbi:MAG: hypothetical protein KC588_01800 [Nitrospira sp.]|nr:hypothetical protein [Nitrospira sp.]
MSEEPLKPCLSNSAEWFVSWVSPLLRRQGREGWELLADLSLHGLTKEIVSWPYKACEDLGRRYCGDSSSEGPPRFDP